MSINVLVPTVILLSVGYVQPTIQATYNEPVANVSYIEATARSSWLDIQVTAEVTMPELLLVDIISPMDSVSFATIKSFAEELGISEQDLIKVVQKLSTDAVTPTDIVSFIVAYQRVFTEAITALDAVANGVTKLLAELLTNTDSQVLSVGKNLNDSVGMLDNMDGNIQYEIVKTMSELLYTSESRIIESILLKADSMTIVSSGVVFMQDYCDITYFLEDYVGTSRTFT